MDMLKKVIDCFALNGLHDRRSFSKIDMIKHGTAARLTDLVPLLKVYYLPCKAKIYLNNITEKKSITILKQILKLHNHVLLSKERNSRHRKIILYQIVSNDERKAVQNIEVQHGVSVNIDFS
jgi:hypothetical protein